MSMYMYTDGVTFFSQMDRTPCHWAAMHGHIDILDLLIKAKCDIEAVDKVNYDKRDPILRLAF